MIRISDLPDAVRDFPLFRDMEPGLLERLLGAAELRTVAPDETFIREGEVDATVYVLVRGEVEVFKATGNGRAESSHTLATLAAPDLVGELTMFDREPRSSSVRAVDSVELLAFDVATLRSADGEVYAEFMRVSGGQIVQRLRNTNIVTVGAMEQRLEESRARISIGVFFVYMISAIAVYTMCLRSVPLIKPYVPGGSRSITVIVLVTMAAICIAAIRKTPYPASTYGLTLDGWRRGALDALVWSVPAILAITLAKYLALRFVLNTPEVPLFDPFSPFSKTGSFNVGFYVTAFVVYVVTAPLQELVVRGSLQSCLQNFLSGSRTRVMWISILTSNLIFATAHSHLRISFALAAFIPGLLWGWLYSRNGTLVAPSVSHVLIGCYVLFVMGTAGLI